MKLLKQKKNIFNLIFLFLFIIILINLVSATNTIPELSPIKVGQCARLIQSCSNCTFNNISSVLYPNSSIAISGKGMTRNGTEYNLTFCRTATTGDYIVNGFGDVDGLVTTWAYILPVTGSGFKGILPFHIFIFVLLYFVALIGIFLKNEWITILGGMGMLVLGIFSINNGIDVYRNSMTNVISLVTIGLGAIFSIVAGISVIENNL